MPNWKVYRIVKIETERSGRPIKFCLDNHIDYRNQKTKSINCVNRHPFTTYKTGDYLEIDLEIMVNNECSRTFGENKNVIRGISCDEVNQSQPFCNLPATFVDQNLEQTLAIGRVIDGLIKQSNGENEYEAKVEVDHNTNKFSYSILGRKRT